jgi:hypothetical protein
MAGATGKDGDRFKTSSSGLGDVRLAGYNWLLDPDANPDGNVALGFGPKFPAGE